MINMTHITSDYCEPFAYRCYLLNVRSHKDYVCLEIDNCPSELDIYNKQEYSIDSSQVVMPVLDKIRFNIKTVDGLIPKWFEKKLQVFAEGKLIFPYSDNHCTKCHGTINGDFTDVSVNTCGALASDSRHESKSILISTGSNTDASLSVTKSRSLLTFKSAFDDSDYSSDDVTSSQKTNKNELVCMSEMLTLNTDSYNDEIITSLSLPEMIFRESFIDKSIQTKVSFGNKSYSYDFIEYINEIGLTPREASHNNITELNYPINLAPIQENHPSNGLRNRSPNTINISKSTNQKLFNNNYSIRDKIRYWSLINAARQMMKINNDIMDLNTVLKSLDIEKSSEKNNLVTSLTPVNLILKLKELNRSSSSLYGFTTDMNTNGGIRQSIQQKWRNLRSNVVPKHPFLNTNVDNENNRFLSKNIKDKKNYLKKRSDQDNLSPQSMDNLFSMQKQMMQMMETFLRNSETSTLDISLKSKRNSSQR